MAVSGIVATSLLLGIYTVFILAGVLMMGLERRYKHIRAEH